MGRINRLVPTTTLTANSVIAMDAESGGATNKVTIQTLAAGLRSFGNYATQTDLNRKQDVLTFDDSPEEDSDNPVTSGGIYNAIGSAMSNVYTKAETDNAIAQSTANMYPIYNATFTKTTSSSGYCSITNDEIAGRYIPIAIFVVGTSDVCVEISASGGTSTAQGSTTWWCACRKVDTWNAVANTSLTFAVYYIRT